MHEYMESLQAMVKAQHEELVKRLGEASAECYKPALIVVVSVVMPILVQGFFTFDKDEKIIESVLIEFDDDGKTHPTADWGL